MNEEIGKIMANSVCPVCGSAKKRDVHVPRFGQGRNVVKWLCTNDKCEKSKQWNLPGASDEIVKEATQAATLSIKIAVMCKEQRSELEKQKTGPKGKELYEELWGIVEETLNKVHCQGESYTEGDATHLLNNILTSLGFVLPSNAYPEKDGGSE